VPLHRPISILLLLVYALVQWHNLVPHGHDAAGLGNGRHHHSAEKNNVQHHHHEGHGKIPLDKNTHAEDFGKFLIKSEGRGQNIQIPSAADHLPTWMEFSSRPAEEADITLHQRSEISIPVPGLRDLRALRAPPAFMC
jgi:hypothetical protein